MKSLAKELNTKLTKQIIYGINPNSFSDYPGKIAFVIFLGGCNFKCPFCHNKSIVLETSNKYDTNDVLSMLKQRDKFIEGVVITGGEPTIWGNDLKDLIKEIRKLGLLVKLDTNGTNPVVLKELLKEGLLDYIAMDIKNSFSKYNETSGIKVDINNIKESIKIIEDSSIDYQFRTTINKTMHTKEDINEIKSYLKSPEFLVLQDYKYSDQQLIDKDFGIFEDN